MWLNPLACMGTGRPLIRSYLMRDIDRPHLTWWTVLRWTRRLIRLKEKKMEASNGGEKNCRYNCNCLSLDLIYEYSPFFLFVSHSRSLGGPLSLQLIVHTQGTQKQQYEQTLVCTHTKFTSCHPLQKVNNDLWCDFLRGQSRPWHKIRARLVHEGCFPVVRSPPPWLHDI